ncbi:S-layer homology domain-containing protein [Priestia abyssalis]|uniref:S-layer homology domain-containing protein n=1 Tax=Priestia abyssalis TaxID=1221450 RepID=UPI0009955044|nr:S-layer homology domain-containing protein [Priestia abyssalis]
MFKKCLTAILATTFLSSVLNSTSTTAATPTFSDVPADHQFAEAINALAAVGTFIGQDGKFDIYGEVTRRQAVLVFSRLMDGEGKMEPVFSDVPVTDEELTKAAYEVNSAGVMTGANGKLMPYAKLTRQQLAKILVKHFDFKRVEGSTVEIDDLDKAHESQREYIQLLAENGITVVADGNFRPTETVTRGQFAAFLYRPQQHALSDKPM